jgi:short-subunit dehydrogenase
MTEHAIVIGASSGIGAAIGAALRARGSHVSGLARRACPASAADASFACDVSIDGAVDVAIDRAAARFGPPSVLVDAAGVGAMGRTIEVPFEIARATFDVNFWGLDRAVRHVVPGMRARGAGCVLAVLSLAALRAIPHEAYYAASKAAAARYLDCLAHEVEQDGVRVRYLCPGFIDTGFLEKTQWFGMDAPRVRGSGVGPDDVARAAIAMIDGRRSGRVLGWRERAITLGDRLAPGLYDAILRRRRGP